MTGQTTLWKLRLEELAEIENKEMETGQKKALTKVKTLNGFPMDAITNPVSYKVQKSILQFQRCKSKIKNHSRTTFLESLEKGR